LRLRGFRSTPIFTSSAASVAVFFIISGYVIYRPFVADRPLLLGYAVRRLVRIVPAYWLVLVCAAWLVPQAVAPVSRLDFGTFFGFGQIYSSKTFFQGLGTAWSLCVEMSFYALVPLFATLMRALGRRRQQLEPWVIVALAGGSVAVRILSPDGVLGGTLLGYFGWFAPGMLLAVIPAERWSKLRIPPVVSWSLAGALFLVIAPRLPPTAVPPQGFMLQYVGFALVAVLIALPVFQARRGASRMGGWLGDRSYGIYLWHFPILVALSTDPAHRLNPILYVTAAVTLTLLAAHASYEWLERPLMNKAAASHARYRLRTPTAGLSLIAPGPKRPA
jgi:peptidoglycan/LPS O-acetylase OafA/YrhL